MKEFPDDPRSRVVRRAGEILVTGATGLLGRHVCAVLARQGRNHRALVRVTSNRDTLTGLGSWMCEGDVTEPGTLTGPLADVETVVHLAGVVRDKDAARNHAVHVDGTRHLIEAARAAGVRRLVAVSSDTVLRARRGVYAETKRRAEELLRAVDDLEVVILRPPMMLGPGSPHLASMLRAARLPVLPLPGGLAPRRPVHVGDVADAAVAAIDVPAEDLPDAPIDLPGAEAIEFGALVRLVARRSGSRPPKLVTVPSALLHRVARVLERLPNPPLTVERLEGMTEEPTVDGRAALELLGWAPLTVDEAVGRSLVDGGVV